MAKPKRKPGAPCLCTSYGHEHDGERCEKPVYGLTRSGALKKVCDECSHIAKMRKLVDEPAPKKDPRSEALKRATRYAPDEPTSTPEPATSDDVELPAPEPPPAPLVPYVEAPPALPYGPGTATGGRGERETRDLGRDGALRARRPQDEDIRTVKF